MKKFLTMYFLLSLFSLNAEKNVVAAQSIFDCIHQNDLVFDIGAHIGKKTSEYLRKGARIVCFEPQPDCCQKLRARFASNQKVTIEQVGLSSKTGSMELFICSSANTISTFSEEFKEKSRHSQRGYTWDKSIAVPVTTLDAMIQKHGMPIFCKIDVENGEHEVLKGLSTPVPFVSIEFHIEMFKFSVRCLDYLSSLGYTHFNFAAGENPNFIMKSWCTKDELMQKILTYSLEYHLSENDPLWGDIYACYQEA